MKYLFALLLSAAFLLAGCGEADDATRPNDFVPLTGITISSAASKVPAGFTNQFTATGNFSDEFTRDITTDVTWESLDSAILTFDNPSSGLGRGVAPGLVSVTARSGDVSDTFEFTVSNATLSSIALTPAAPSVAKGRTQQFLAKGTFSDASTLDITPDLVAWKSSDTAIVTVDAAGVAKAEKVGGPVTITASHPKDAAIPVTGTAQMTVTAAGVESIRLTPAPPLLVKGETHQFTAEAVLSDGSTAPVASAVWSSDTPGVATVNETTGLATAVAAGTTTISAKDAVSGLSGTMSLTVGTVTAISITPINPTLAVGGQEQLTATATMSNGSTRDITAIATWSSDNTGVATVNDSSSKGLVTGVLGGIAKISATKDVPGSTNVTVQ